MFHVKQAADSVTKDMFNDTERMTIQIALNLYIKTLARQIKAEPNRNIRQIRETDMNAAMALANKLDELK